MRKKLLTLLTAAMTALMAVTPAFASGQKVINEVDTGTLTVRYFDDQKETEPVSGARFALYLVGTIDTDIITSVEDMVSYGLTGNEADVEAALIDNGCYTSVIPGLEITGDTTVEEAREAAKSYYDSNGAANGTYTGVTGSDGILIFSDLEPGLYVVIETQAAAHHLPSVGFFVSVPETVASDNGSYWNFDVTAEPKAAITGALTASKEISGTAASASDSIPDKNETSASALNAKDTEDTDKTAGQPKTGDELNRSPFIGGAFLACAGIAFIICRKTKNDQN